ncbi:hypothetical protein D3C74_435410 [compost metagenome]
MACRRIGRRDRRHDNQGFAFGYAFRRINGLASAESDGAGTGILPGQLLEARDLLACAFAPEIALYKRNLEFIGGKIKLRLHTLHIIRVGDKKC